MYSNRAFECSVDLMFVELHQSILSTDFQDALGIFFDALSSAKTSVSFTFKSKAHSSLHSSHVNY